jgi:4-hydroxy-tetrahydrodipicolinate synthase
MSYEFVKENFRGISTLIFTPFDHNNEINEPVLRDLIAKEKQILKGRKAIFMMGGSLSEFYTMSDAETKRYIDIACDAVGSEFPLVMGVSRAATDYTIELAQYAEAKGVDAIMVLPPYYMMPTNEGLYDHFAKIANSIKCGVALYNNSTNTKIAISPAMVAKLSKIENIVAIKENTSNITHFETLMTTVDPKDMTVSCGQGYTFYPYAALSGVRGFVTELINIMPKAGLAIQDAADADDYTGMMKVLRKLSPYGTFNASISAGVTLPSIFSQYQAGPAFTYLVDFMKCATSITNNVDYGHARMPGALLTGEQREQLADILHGLAKLDW